MTGTQDLPMDLPIVDLDAFLRDPTSGAARAECEKAARALVTYGALVLHDARVAEDDNATFLDLLEDYFALPPETLRRDERPDLGFQVGVTLENTEKPKCAVDEPCLDVISRLAPAERPLDISAHSPDPKCRFFWSMAGAEKPPYATRFPALNAENIVPDDVTVKDRWTPVMQKWGTSMKSAYVFSLRPLAGLVGGLKDFACANESFRKIRVSGLAEMAAVGLGLPASTFTDAGRYG